MLDLEIDGDPETKQVHRLTLDYLGSDGTDDGDLQFLTKLANGLIRGATIVIDPGLATEFVYEAGEPVEEQSGEASE
jgi:hypothetical protein